MKRLIPLCLALIVFTQASAFAADKVMYSCEDIYALQLNNKIEKRDNFNHRWNRSRGAVSIYTGATAAGIVIGLATVSVPILIVGVLTPTAISAIKNLPSREERVLKLQEESSSSFKRYVKKLKRQVSKDITAEEVSELIQEGFDSGLYCQDLPKVLTPKEIRAEVKEILSERYGVAEKK